MNPVLQLSDFQKQLVRIAVPLRPEPEPLRTEQAKVARDAARIKDLARVLAEHARRWDWQLSDADLLQMATDTYDDGDRRNDDNRVDQFNQVRRG